MFIPIALKYLIEVWLHDRWCTSPSRQPTNHRWDYNPTTKRFSSECATSQRSEVFLYIVFDSSDPSSLLYLPPWKKENKGSSSFLPGRNMLALELYEATSPEWKGCFSLLKCVLWILGFGFGISACWTRSKSTIWILFRNLLAALREHAIQDEGHRQRQSDTDIFPYLPVTIVSCYAIIHFERKDCV